MGEIMKFGAKSTEGIATAVQCNEEGNLITEKNWESDFIPVYSGMPTSELFTDKINLQKTAISSLRIVNTTDAEIDVGLEQDFPPLDLYSFDWGVCQAIAPQQGETFTFKDNTAYSRSFVSTRNVVSIGSKNVKITVASGYTLTGYIVDSSGVYSGSYSTTSGTSRVFSAGTYYIFRIVKSQEPEEQSSIYNYLEKLSIDEASGKHLYNLLTGEQYKVTVPSSTASKVYTICSSDWDIMTCLFNLMLRIYPKTTPTEGTLEITLITKR